MTLDEKWDLRFLRLAAHVATWSKDPSTQSGACVVRGRRIVSLGYNGFPQRCKDTPTLYADRTTKYSRVVHSEINAIVFAHRDLTNCTLYTWPFMSCSRCAGVVIQSGISRCVAPMLPPHLAERWQEDMERSRELFEEAGVHLCLYPPEFFQQS